MKQIKNKHHAGRIASLLIAFCMIIALIPATAFADGEEDTPITAIEITNIETPVVGEKATYSATIPENVGYVIAPCEYHGVDISWLESDTPITSIDDIDDATWYFKGKELTFKEGKYYMAGVWLKAEEGYVFAEKDELNITMNGKIPTFVDQSENFNWKLLDVYLDFGQLKAQSDGTDGISGTATPTTTTNDKSPETGDDSNMFLWLAVLLASGAVVVGTTVYGRRRKHSA